MNDVTFRRIRGRIVPIRKKKKDMPKGAGTIGAGVAVAASGGLLYRGAVKAAEKQMEKAARVFSFAPKAPKGVQMTFDDLLKSDIAKKQATKFMTRASLLERATPHIRRASTLAGGTLIGVGASQVVKSMTDDSNDPKADAIGVAAGTLATIAFATAFKPTMVSRAFKRFIKR